MKKKLVIIYHLNPTNDFVSRVIAYYNGRNLGNMWYNKQFIPNLYPDEKPDVIRYCFCKKLTDILRKQEQVAEGYPYNQVGFPGYNDRDIQTFEQMNISNDDLIDIPENCLDYSVCIRPNEHPTVDIIKFRKECNMYNLMYDLTPEEIGNIKNMADDEIIKLITNQEYCYNKIYFQTFHNLAYDKFLSYYKYERASKECQEIGGELKLSDALKNEWDMLKQEHEMLQHIVNVIQSAMKEKEKTCNHDFELYGCRGYDREIDVYRCKHCGKEIEK